MLPYLKKIINSNNKSKLLLNKNNFLKSLNSKHQNLNKINKKKKSLFKIKIHYLQIIIRFKKKTSLPQLISNLLLVLSKKIYSKKLIKIMMVESLKKNSQISRIRTMNNQFQRTTLLRRIKKTTRRQQPKSIISTTSNISSLEEPF